MIFKEKNYFYSEGQFRNEIGKCTYCEEKPCYDACPAGVSAADFIMASKIGEKSDIQRAAARILIKNPLGGVCGMVCPDTFCMKGCSHREFDESLNIPAIQSKIIYDANQKNIIPKFKKAEPNGKKIAIIGAGPSGLSAAAILGQLGYIIEIFEAMDTAGGACNLIPKERLSRDVLKDDIDFILSLSNISLKTGKKIDNPESLLSNYDAVIVATGLWDSIKPGIENEDKAIFALDYLLEPSKYNMKGERVAIIGGGAVAADCSFTAGNQGADNIEMFTLEIPSEMNLTKKEMSELIENGTVLNSRTSIKKINLIDNTISGISGVKVELEKGQKFNLKYIKEKQGSDFIRDDFTKVIIAIGSKGTIKKIENDKIFFTGDTLSGPSTVVEAVASGKNTAYIIDAKLSGKIKPKIEDPNKSDFEVPGYNKFPISVETDFFGFKIESPFILSAAPPTDGYDQMKAAFEAGWAGGIMKTVFDNVPIHIPAQYMFLYNNETYANCDNVSGHSLNRACEEVKKLRKEFPTKLVMVSTGGPVTGNDEEDKQGWQSNTKKLEDAGVLGIEYSLSCPQGGDGTEGDIVSQNAELTAKIIDWVMEISNPEIPKLFKLTGAVTSIVPIINAIKKVFEKYPNKKAGITLANTFPTLDFRKGEKKEWEEGIILGMSGDGVRTISNLTLSNVINSGVYNSGNGGPMNYKAAADFLALGVQTVQFCTLVTKYGYNIYDEMIEGLSKLMEERGISSIKELVGRAGPKPVRDFMDLSPIKQISDVNAELCESCGNCARCPYRAITLNTELIPETDPSKCIGCGICVLKCFSQALFLRDRTQEEKNLLKED